MHHPHELDGGAVVDFIHVEGQLLRGGWVVGGKGGRGRVIARQRWTDGKGGEGGVEGGVDHVR
jgi:hypothetical protein